MPTHNQVDLPTSCSAPASICALCEICGSLRVCSDRLTINHKSPRIVTLHNAPLVWIRVNPRYPWSSDACKTHQPRRHGGRPSILDMESLFVQGDLRDPAIFLPPFF